MAGDYTRFRYNPMKDTSGVQMQQGRVLLDQDWNEYVQLLDRRWRAETMDIIGRAVVPIDTPTAFELLIGGTSFTIGIGRMYVDGLLAENHGIDPTDPTKRLYDPILGELIGTSPVPYELQPYDPNPPAFPADGNPHLVYLDVWERELTYLEDPGLIDQAVAVDTGTRIQTVWQVKVLEDTPAGTTCATPPGTVSPWVTATAPSAGRLTTAAAGVPSSTDPCIVPPNGGYRGSGNRCYRIEIHNGGAMGTAQFKWSRDNASVATAVTGINAALDTLSVVLTKRDSVLRFQPDDWVEVTDDFRYFQGLGGEMRQVAAVDDVNLTIQLKTTLPAGEFDATKPDRHTRVILWNQHGIVRDPIGNVIVDVDANGGLIPTPAAGTTIVLEDGIQITFTIDAAMPLPRFNALDYWMFDARVIDASVEILTQAPPRGILHHYAWLGFVSLPGGPATSCRVFWPPEMGESCDCTVCVSAISHNSGTLTIQSAINQVTGLGGGKVCLGPGIYNITDMIVVNSNAAIEISGHGLPSLVAATGSGFSPQKSMMLIDSSVDTILEDIAWVGPVVGPNQPPIPAVVIMNSSFATIKRCVFTSQSSVLKAGAVSSLSPAIGVQGVAWGAQIRNNLFTNVAVAVGPSQVRDPIAAFLAYSAIENNEMGCTEAGVSFADPTLVASFLEVSFADNTVWSPMGFQFRGLGLGVSIERNAFVVNAVPPSLTVAFVTAAIVSSASASRISDNRIAGDPKNPGEHGIILDWTVISEVQVTGNLISALTGNGVLVRQGTRLLEAIVSRNQMVNLGGAGIASETRSFALNLAITSNVMNLVGLTSTNTTDFMAGILLQATASIDVTITENDISGVGPSAAANPRIGIYVGIVADLRVAGNRVVDIGPVTPVLLGGAIVVVAVVGRADISGNEGRRASAPPLNGDASFWGALLLLIVAGDANVRGNQFESFGSSPAVLVGLARSCVFCDNQCFLDNPVGNLPLLVVKIGDSVKLNGGAIIASNNYVQTQPIGAAGGFETVMNLNPLDQTKTLTVLGNITSGLITVGTTVLGTPWAPLNAVNV
jgi:hypothetical protein